MMASAAPSTSYAEARDRLQVYFDRTAVEQWKAITSDVPVSRIRATVRAGRDRMRETLLSWLPQDMQGLRLLDAGCGTGALAVEAARRGATVVAVDVSAQLVDVARDRAPEGLSIDWRVGDMLSAELGALRPCRRDGFADPLRGGRHDRGGSGAQGPHVAFGAVHLCAFQPLLEVMHSVGKIFPRGDRAPAIAPVRETRLRASPGRWPHTAHFFWLLQEPGARGAGRMTGWPSAGPGWERSSCPLRMRQPPSFRWAGCCACRCSRSAAEWLPFF
jgi:magnesium-protoporphyrin O-methyltransferase